MDIPGFCSVADVGMWSPQLVMLTPCGAWPLFRCQTWPSTSSSHFLFGYH